MPDLRRPGRDHSTICVVEQVADVLSIENTHQYKGLYHVLGGVISPMQGISPSDLKIDLLCERIARGGVRGGHHRHFDLGRGRNDAVLPDEPPQAVPRIENHLHRPGIGFGDELEYVDELTITHALLNRREIE